MQFYENYLKSINTCVEDLIEWYFHKNIRDVYSVNNYSFAKSSSKTTFYERCKLLLPEMEGILKQYNLLVEEGEIEQDLLEIKSEHLLLKNCKSLVEKKYIYKQENDFLDTLFYLLFSDQCILAYVSRININYRCFFDLILNESINTNDFGEYEQNELNWLFDNNVIVDEDDRISFKSMERVFIFYDLYVNRVISYYRVPLDIKTEIDQLITEGLLISESTLFSKPEQEYFNYHLNMSTFNNSLDIRNRYSHRTQPHKDKIQEHQNNYYTILKLFILILLKIDDDLNIYKLITKKE
jgi:hypothetical protein